MSKTYIYHQGQITRKQARRKGLELTKAEFHGGAMVLFMVKLGFTDLSPLQKVFKSSRILKCMTGNAHFPSPKPTLAQVDSAIQALALAQREINGAKAKTVARNLREAELDVVMRELQAYVEFTAKGNTEIILSSGFEVCNPKNIAVGLLPFPEGFRAVNTPVEGQIKLKWKRVARRVTYVVEYAFEPDIAGKKWTAQSAKSRLVLNGLSPDSKYYFRIATSSPAGRSGFSPWIACRPN